MRRLRLERPIDPPHGLLSGEGGGRSGFADLRAKLTPLLEVDLETGGLSTASFILLLDAYIPCAHQRRLTLALVGIELGSAEPSAGEVARAVRSKVRTTDELGRLAGGRLALLLPGFDPVFAPTVITRLRVALAPQESGSEPRANRIRLALARSRQLRANAAASDWLRDLDASLATR